MATQIPPSYVPVLVACVASVSVRFRSKERERESKWRSFHFSRGQSRESRSSVLLCSETKRKRLRRRLLSRTIISTLRTVRLVPMNIKWHLCDVNARPYCFAILGMRGSFDSIFLGISVARKLETYRKSSNKQSPPPLFRGRKLISPPSFSSPPPLPLNIIIIHDSRESIATVKIRLDESRMVYSPAWGSDFFLILGCISSRFLYFSFSTLPSSLWRTDTIFFAKLNKPSPLSHKPHVFITLPPSQMCLK